MKAKIKDQSHRVTLKITEARVSLLQQLSPSMVMLQIAFLATHYCKTEMQEVTVEEETTMQEVEVATEFVEPIVYDTITQEVEFDLWIGIVKAAENPQILLGVNQALVTFSQLFVNSMEGLVLELERVEMG